MDSLKTLQNITDNSLIIWFKGALNWAPMMPRGTSLSSAMRPVCVWVLVLWRPVAIDPVCVCVRIQYVHTQEMDSCPLPNWTESDFIYHFSIDLDFRLVPNLSENVKYNLISESISVRVYVFNTYTACTELDLHFLSKILDGIWSRFFIYNELSGIPFSL